MDLAWGADNIPANGVVRVGAGQQHSACVSADGDVYAWGDNANGQLGTGSLAVQYYPTKMTWGGSAAPVGGAVDVACGEVNTVILGADSVVYAVGDNSAYQLLTGSTTRWSNS